MLRFYSDLFYQNGNFIAIDAIVQTEKQFLSQIAKPIEPCDEANPEFMFFICFAIVVPWGWK